jgi:NAD(P)-dependent dehydrogenase (short-subunit alcohol dehydrogenase family)
LEGYSESLRLELKPFGIDVVLVEPGSYQTNIWSSVDKIKVDPNSPYRFYMEAMMKEIESGKSGYGDPFHVARLVAEIADMEKTPKLRYPIGKGVKMNLFMKAFLPWKWIERAVLKKLLK